MPHQFILTPYFLDEPTPGLRSLYAEGWQWNDPELPNDDQQGRMTAIHRPLAEKVADAVKSGKTPVSIAGDCCTTLGMIAGLQKAELNPVLVWFDAHGDFNTWETTPSGFLGGMPLAMLTGRGELRMANAVGMQTLPDTDVILTDGRDLDAGEQKLVDESDLYYLPNTPDLLTHPLPERPLYIHFDTDILRPEDAPAMRYLAKGGPTVDEMAQVFRHLAKTGQIAAVSVSAWNPAMEGAARSQENSLMLLNTLLEQI